MLLERSRFCERGVTRIPFIEYPQHRSRFAVVKSLFHSRCLESFEASSHLAVVAQAAEDHVRVRLDHILFMYAFCKLFSKSHITSELHCLGIFTVPTR